MRLSAADLAGRVVLVEFWTFECWNCKHVEPYVKRWHERYAKDGLLILGFSSDL
jgi:thiol-disulfide isomerase/thioredoxin